tara:strand:+ start:4434 stop:6881 length:2448 start_codon:yes stop_codon:yes gene_type:complete
MLIRFTTQGCVESNVSFKKNNQSKIEDEMVALGRDRYLHKIKRARETSLESTTGVGQHLLSESIGLMSAALKNWLRMAKKTPGRRHRAYPLLSQLPPTIVSGLTSQAIIDCISEEKKIASTAISIGRLIEDEIKWRKVKEDEPALWNQINRELSKQTSKKSRSKFMNKTIRYHKLVVSIWSREEAASVGLTCIELLRQSTGIIETVTRRDPNGKTYTIVKATDELIDWMRSAHDYREPLNPVWLPSVEPAVDWNNPYIGGYSSMGFRRRPLVKTLDKSFLEELGACPMPEFYDALNTVQRVRYRIDPESFDVLKTCWDRNLPVDGVPSIEDDPVPNKPSDISHNAESRAKWRRRAARVHFDNERMKSKRIQVMRVMNLCEKFHEDELSFVRQVDFRGRGYSVPNFLQHQGPSYVQSLLRFSSGEPITDSGAMWLYVSAASKWGLDKEPYKDRLKWAEENIELIKSIGRSPHDNLTWTDAEDPWMFRATCSEISKMHDQGSSFKSTLPISMDATNQGLQIYSMLLLDPKGAESVNVTPGDRPRSIYGAVAEIVNRKLKSSDDPYAKRWIDFGVDSRATKRPTMTLVYGSTFYSCRTYTADWFYDQLKSGKQNPFDDETYRPCNFLARIIWESIDEQVHAARVGMDWLRKCATLFVDNKITPRWVTPLGFPVKMLYEKTNKQAVKTLVGGTLRQHRIRVPNGKTNRRKTVNAICANFIHSIDGLGGLLGEIVNTASSRGINQIKDVHDSISCHASNVDVLHECIRESTVKLFSQNQMEILANQLACQLPSTVSLPELPPRGSLNIEDVLRSNYYFNI